MMCQLQITNLHGVTCRRTLICINVAAISSKSANFRNSLIMNTLNSITIFIVLDPCSRCTRVSFASGRVRIGKSYIKTPPPPIWLQSFYRDNCTFFFSFWYKVTTKHVATHSVVEERMWDSVEVQEKRWSEPEAAVQSVFRAQRIHRWHFART